jgi:hypothetical protein
LPYFSVLAEVFAGFLAETVAKEVKRWPELKRLQKKLAFLPPLFPALFADFIMSINKLATKLLPLLKN